MTRNFLLNALLAALYIHLIGSFIYYMPNSVDHTPGPLAPVLFLSLFVFSAAMMGFLFFYQPLALFLEGQKKEATYLFLKTIATFGLLAGLVFMAIIFLT